MIDLIQAYLDEVLLTLEGLPSLQEVLLVQKLLKLLTYPVSQYPIFHPYLVLPVQAEM